MSLDLLALLDRLSHPRVLVLGDLMLDRYTLGAVDRISPEAPIPILHASEQRDQLGGAASVAAMLGRLDAHVRLASIRGADEPGEALVRLIGQAGIDPSLVLVDAGRPTTVKHRFIGRAGDRHAQQMFRVDVEARDPLPASLEEALLHHLEHLIPEHDAVLVSDYGKGVCTPRLIQQVIALARHHDRPVLVDPPRLPDLSHYRGATCLTPNRPEAAAASAMPVGCPVQGIQAATHLQKQLDVDALIITLDRDGMVLAHRDGTRRHFPTQARAVYDVTGAGDMVLAVLGLCLACRIDLAQAIPLANLAAGREVEFHGVVTFSRDDLRAEARRAETHPPRRT